MQRQGVSGRGEKGHCVEESVESWLVLRETDDEMRQNMRFFLTQAVCCSVWPSQFGDSGSWLLGLDVQGQRKRKKEGGMGGLGNWRRRKFNEADLKDREELHTPEVTKLRMTISRANGTLGN
jgi:hypothetical protein